MSERLVSAVVAALPSPIEATKTVEADPWRTWIRIAMITVPYVVALAMVMLAISPIAEITGLGPISRWAWDEFTVAGSVGMRAVIAVVTLAATGGAMWAIYKAGLAISRWYGKQL